MPSEESSQPKLFQCPNCGASLPDPETVSVKCVYCGSSVLVPPEYLPEDASTQALPYQTTTVIHLDTQTVVPSRAGGRSAARIILFLVILVLVIGIGFTVLTAAGIFVTTKRVVSQVNVEFTPENSVRDTLLAVIPTLEAVSETPIPTSLPFAERVLSFGGEGSGAGQFLDPRRIAVDHVGNIYVADFNSGRIQKFDPLGNFSQMWIVEAGSNQSKYISDLAVDATGRLYAVRGGDILAFDESDQTPSAVIEGDFPQTYHSALAVDPANNLYSLAHSLSGDDLVKMNRDGHALLRTADIIYAIDENSPPQNDVIAADGLGNTYFVSVFNPQIFKYDSSGKFADRLGSPGNGLEQLDHPTMLVVDGKGRLYILDSSAIKILDQTGAFLESIPWDYSSGSPRDLAVDLQGNLYIVTSQGLVLKYKLAW